MHVVVQDACSLATPYRDTEAVVNVDEVKTGATNEIVSPFPIQQVPDRGKGWQIWHPMPISEL